LWLRVVTTMNQLLACGKYLVSCFLIKFTWSVPLKIMTRLPFSLIRSQSWASSQICTPVVFWILSFRMLAIRWSPLPILFWDPALIPKTKVSENLSPNRYLTSAASAGFLRYRTKVSFRLCIVGCTKTSFHEDIPYTPNSHKGNAGVPFAISALFLKFLEQISALLKRIIPSVVNTRC
jgi:hypothetical protein